MTVNATRPTQRWRVHRSSLVVHVAALATAFAGLGMVASALVEAVDGGPDVVPLLACGIPTSVVALAVWRLVPPPEEVQILDVFLTVTLAWAALSTVGAIPYLATGRLDALDQALFEAVSGFTTTGATVLRPISETSQGLLFYRAITQWIGGMGVIVLVVAVLPTVGGGGMSLLQAEAPGPVGERLTPRVRQTARRLWSVYLGLTVAVAAGYLVAGMSLFDAVAHSFTTVSTGGFSPRNASIAHFGSPVIEWIAIAGMFLAGASFTLHYRALRGDPWVHLRSAEFRAYAAIVALVTGAVFLVADAATGVGTHLRDSLFTVVSLGSTTGYSTADFGQWSDAAQVTLLLLLPIGAMAGSTAGGVKIVRLVAVASYAHRAALRQLLPQLVRPVRVGASTLPEEVASRVVGFMIMALAIFGGGAVAIAFTGEDLVTAFSAAATSFGNVGPGLGDVGPTGDYLAIPWTARLVTMVQMLLGRLEIYPVILAMSVVTLRRRRRRISR